MDNAEHIYWVFKNAINKDTCKQIIDLSKGKWNEGTVGGKKAVDEKVRKSDVVWSNDEWLFNICWEFLHTANKNSNWNFEISACEPMQITKYEKDGHYDFHYDGDGFTRFNNPSNKFLHRMTRKLSMTIVLNEDYEGGEFEFFEDKNLIKEKMGTVIVFPSYMVHKVRPVTSGTRYSLVAWFCGQPFK